MLERKESSVTIFRGDDTGGQLGKTIVINFHCGDTVNMEGVVVTFILGGFYEKEFHNVHDGDRLEIFMTHEQTAMLPLGVSFGKLYGTDASGKIRTFSNRIPIRVTNRVCEAYGSAEESEIDVTISNAITWDSIFGKPETFPPSEHRHQKSDIDNLESDLKTLSNGVESAIEAANLAQNKADEAQNTANVASDKADAVYAELANKLDKTAFADHTENTNNPHNVTAAQVGAVSISRSPDSDQTFDWSPSGVDSNIRLFGTFYKTGIGLGLWSGGGSLFNYHDDTSDIYQFPTGESGTLALTSDIEDAVKNKVGSFASVGGASATVENGIAKLSDFFTNSNSLLTGTIDARLPYPLNAVPSTGLLKDRALNTTSLASVTVPDNFTDLLIRASVASSLSVTMPSAITTKYGDTFPGAAGEYLITITKTGAAEAYVRTIKLEVANA